MKSRKQSIGTSMSTGIGVITGQRTILGGDRRGSIAQTPLQSRSRPAAMRSSEVVVTEPPKALAAAHYAGMTLSRLIAVKESTLGVSPGGRLVITPSQIRARLREMLLVETGDDLDEMAGEGLFPPTVNATTRMGLQLPIQSTYFCEVKCRVGVTALRAANTPEKLVNAIWAAIPLAHRQSLNVVEEASAA